MHFQTKISRRQQWAACIALSCCLASSFLPNLTLAARADAGIAAGQTASTSSYQIVPEDVLDITVIDHPEATKVVAVMTDGTINFPFVGQISVTGMTIVDLQKRLAKDLSKQFVHPQVIINVAQRKIRTFSTAGVLKATGKHPLKDGERLLEALSDAGGLPAERAEFYSAKILRDGQEIPIDLPKLFANDVSQNIVVLPDDYIWVTDKEPSQTTVQVLGEVLKPGPMIWPRDGSIISVLQGAGGPTPRARLSQVTIERNGQDLPVIDLRNYQKNGFEPPMKLEPGDKLIVPLNKQEYNVTGPVLAPGSRLYPDDKKVTVFSALIGGASTEPGQQGGLTLEGANLKKVQLIHPLGDGKTDTKVVDVEHMWKTGDLSGDLPVQPGDTVVVPPDPGRRGISLGEALGYASGLITVLLFFRH